MKEQELPLLVSNQPVQIHINMKTEHLYLVTFFTICVNTRVLYSTQMGEFYSEILLLANCRYLYEAG